MGSLSLVFGSSEKNNDIYVLANEDDELEENDDRPDDYKNAKASNFEKSILSKLIGAGFIDNALGKGEDLNRSEVNGNKEEGSEKENWKPISGKWKEREKNKDNNSIKDLKTSNTSEYSEVSFISKKSLI